MPLIQLPVCKNAIVIAVLIGLGIIAALVFVIIRGRKARIAGVYPHPSTSGQKQSVLDFNKATAFSRGIIFTWYFQC
jgi:hypothetical protein